MNNKTKILCDNKKDADGLPAGGTATGTGLQVTWQDGPRGYGRDKADQNGATVEDLLVTAMQRLVFYQGTPMKCRQTSIAIMRIEESLLWLHGRTAERLDRGVEGRMQP